MACYTAGDCGSVGVVDTSINRSSFAAALCAALLAMTSDPMAAQQVPCHEVLRELHRSELIGRLGGPEPGRVAAKLKTSSAWVDRCATLYGRRLKDRERARKRRESQEPIWELHEPGEIARVIVAWRVAAWVGLTGMLGSFGWFAAFTLQNAAYVKALGQVELMFYSSEGAGITLVDLWELYDVDDDGTAEPATLEMYLTPSG